MLHESEPGQVDPDELLDLPDVGAQILVDAEHGLAELLAALDLGLVLSEQEEEDFCGELDLDVVADEVLEVEEEFFGVAEVEEFEGGFEVGNADSLEDFEHVEENTLICKNIVRRRLCWGIDPLHRNCTPFFNLNLIVQNLL